MLETKIIGKKITEARKKINISQAKLAQLLSISSQAVGKWERGESMPDITTFNRLAEILGVDLNYFSNSFNVSATEMTPAEPSDNKTGQGSAILPTPSDRQVLNNLSARDLSNSDFAGIVAHKGEFFANILRNSDFSGADLTGSLFKSCHAQDINFNRTNLTDCNFSILDLSDASFLESILLRTYFSISRLDGAKFIKVKLTDVSMIKCDLRKVVFESCTFDGVNFEKSDMRGLCLDGQAFTDVKFDNAALNDVTFKGATLKNVSFRAPYAITNKYYRTIKTIRFEGAMIDKLTYAALNGAGADLSKVIII
ncbi:MAG: pentapeptide repeat-containing protein [Ignavibacteriales bacterium]|nr:pentapeptide repeat-containing protein [Ignavibacteriales bacterium]